MKRINVLLVALLTMCSIADVGASSSINFGSSNSNFTIASGANFVVAGVDANLVVNDGTIKYVNEDDVASGFTCSRAQIVKVGEFSGEVTGTFASNGDITLGNNEKLIVHNGQTPGNITVTSDAGNAAIIEGTGSLGTVTVGSGKEVKVDLQSTLSNTISGAGQVTLLNDLALADSVQVTAATIAGNGYKLVLGGDDITMINATTMNDLDIVLNADMKMEQKWTVATGACSLIGNGRVMDFANVNAGLDLGSTSLGFYLSNVKLQNLSAANISNPGDLYCTDVIFHDQATNGMFRVVGETQISVTNGNLLGAAVTWDSAATLELLSDIALSTTWTASGDLTLLGNGNQVDMTNGQLALGSNDLYASNTNFVELSAGSYSGSGDMYLSNVGLIDASGNETIRIFGSNSASAQSMARVSPDTGEFFSDAVTWVNGANIELHSKITLRDTWTFSETSQINGYANILDVSDENAKIFVASGKTLYLSNLVIAGLSGNTSTGPISCEDDTASVRLVDVTFMLAQDMTLSSGTWFVDGESTFVTGNKKVTLTELDGGTRLTVTGCTLFYDTLAFPDSHNISHAKPTSGILAFGNNGDSDTNGRIARVLVLDVGDMHITGNEQLSETKSLYQDTDGGYGVQLYFDNDDVSTPKTIAFNGAGRSLLCADTRSDDSNSLIIVEENTTVTARNIVFDGMVSDNISYTDNGGTLGAMVFGPYAVWKLGRDDTLTRAYIVNTGATTTPCTLDLNGQELTIDATNKFTIAASSKLIIQNGTLNVVGACLVPADDTAEIEFKDVAIKLRGNASLAEYEKVSFGGECRIFGSGDYTITLNQAQTGGDDNIVEIKAGSRLMVESGSTLEYASDGTFSFASTRSILELRGGTFKTSGAAAAANDGAGIILKTGRLVADHLSVLSGNMVLGDTVSPLNIELFPSAKVTLETGSNITYANLDT